MVSSIGNRRAAAGTPRPVPPTGTPPSVNSSGRPLSSAAPPAGVSSTPPAVTSATLPASSGPTTTTHADPSHGPQTPLTPNLAIVVRNAPSEAGTYLAPLHLSWSPIVTVNGQVVTSGCSVSWSLYLDSTLYYQTPATPCASSSVNDLLLNVGDYRLVGKAVVDSAKPVVASIPIAVEP
jgi:hypothetical protein